MDALVAVYNRIEALNQHVGEQMHADLLGNSLIRHAAEIISFTADEALWFTIPGIGACLLIILRGFGARAGMGCLEEALWDCFGAMMTISCVESWLKLIFRKQRPTYAKQSENFSVLGEWYTFPSGHAMRAFYVIFYITRSHFVDLLSPYIWLPHARYFVPWALGVAWSRVAKGRHFPIDVICGSIIGAAVGYYIEDVCSPTRRMVLKTIGGLYTALGWGILAFIPTFAGDVLWKKWLVGVVYYVFGVTVLIFTIPATLEMAGMQTIVAKADGSGAECLAFWF